MNEHIEQRLTRIEQANRRLRWTVLVLALIVPGMAAMLHSESAQEPPSQSNQSGNDTPPSIKLEEHTALKARNLDDVRREYDSQSLESLKARKQPAPTERPPFRVVDAEVFVVLDKNRNVRAEIGVDDANSPCLRMYDQAGHRRIELTETAGAGMLKLFDDSGRTTLQLLQSESDVRISLGAINEAGKSAVELTYGNEKNGMFLNGPQAGQELSLEIDRGQGPQLNLNSTATQSSYRSDGLNVASNAGGLSFYLNPGKRAALSFSARSPVAGQEGVEIGTSPESAWLGLKSLNHGANAHLLVQPDTASFGLKPSIKEAVMQLGIHERKEGADSQLLMRSDRGEESVQLNLDEVGPRINFFNAKGESPSAPHPSKTPLAPPVDQPSDKAPQKPTN